MRRGVTAIACSLTVTIGSLGLVAASQATAAAAAAGTYAPPAPVVISHLKSFHQMVADSAAGSSHGYLFFSGGGGSNTLGISTSAATAGIVVTDLSGNYVTTLDTGTDVEGLALSPGGSTLYAAESTDRAVAAINVSSIASGAPSQVNWPLPSGDIPYGLALESGKLWVSYAIWSNAFNEVDGAEIGDFPLPGSPDGIPSFETQPTMGTAWNYATELAADPGDSGVVVALQDEPAEAASFDVSSGTVTVVRAATKLGSATCPTASQLAVLDGGASFAVDCGAEYSTTTMAQQASFLSDGPVATDAGGVLETSAYLLPGGPPSRSGVQTYRAGINSPVNKYVFPQGPVITALAVTVGDLDVYALAGDQGSLELQVLPGLTEKAATVALKPSSTSVVSGQQRVTFTGTLAMEDGEALPPGATITVTRTSPNGTTTTLPPVPVSGHTFTFTGLPAGTGNYTYAASYAGVPADQITSSSTTVTISATADRARLALRGATLVTYGRRVTVRGTLALAVGTPPRGTVVTVTRRRRGSSAVKAFTERTGSGGGFTIADGKLPKGVYTFRARYAGSPSNTPATASRRVKVARTKPKLAIVTGKASYVYGTRVTVRAKLRDFYSDRWVTIYATPHGRRKVRIAHRRVNSHGILRVKFRLWRTTKFTAVFRGDRHNLPVTVSRTIGSRAGVRMRGSGYVHRVKELGATYAEYRDGSPLSFTIRVAPNKHGQCVKLVLQQLNLGTNRWVHKKTYGCFSLNSASRRAGHLIFRNVNYRIFRIRAVYHRSRTDKRNEDGASGWFHFTYF